MILFSNEMLSEMIGLGNNMYDFDAQAALDDLNKTQIHEMETMIDCLLIDPLANPLHVQHLIAESAYNDVRGKCAYALLGLYAIGKVEWAPGDPWTGKPGSWVSKKKGDIKTDYSIN